jgi:Cu+-exporting ATPase
MMDAASAISGYRDPVCGMNVRGGTAYRYDYAGEINRFCSAGCLAKFKADPHRYLSMGDLSAHPASEAAAKWTCPMHPQVDRDGPGSCPICGMVLEPRTVSLADEENP